MKKTNNTPENFFIINGIKYPLSEDVQSLEYAINHDLNPIFHDVITVYIDKIGKNHLIIKAIYNTTHFISTNKKSASYINTTR